MRSLKYFIALFFISTITFYAQQIPMTVDTALTNSNNLPSGVVKSTDPWTAKNVITIEELAKELKSKKDKPVVLQIGFESLYYYARIPGAIYAGPGRSEDGIKLLKSEAKKLKKNQNIVLYCGCCMWHECPNVRPAFETMKKLGFKNAKVLYIPDSFNADWMYKDYPVAKGKN